jgi:hypothetical protein
MDSRTDRGEPLARPVLPRPAVPAFLDLFDGALGHLLGLLDSPLGFGRASRPVERLRATIGCLRYLHTWPERFTLEASFTVDVGEHGFPGLKDVYLIEQDRAQAAEKLAVLPGVERIIESAVRDIRSGRFPLVWQRALIQRRYYERLLRTSLISGFEVGTPRLGAERGERAVHAIDWSGLDADDSAFLFYGLEFTTDPSLSPPARVEPSGELFRTLHFCFREPLGTQFDHLETLADVNPQVLTRLRIGPFHTGQAPGTAAIGEALARDPAGWLLECTVERLARGDAEEAGRGERVARARASTGTSPPEAALPSGAPALTRVLLCPAGVKERLGGADPDGRPARVFGVGAGGEVRE